LFAAIGIASDTFGQERRRNTCRRNDRVTIEDLNMSPDPISRGQRVRSWRVVLGFDGRQDCETDILIRDSNGNVVAREEGISLRRGTNEIRLRPDEKYEFRGNENCMRVIVNLENSQSEPDARRRFCARQRTIWTMREPES
jgi:hypothetical protein